MAYSRQLSGDPFDNQTVFRRETVLRLASNTMITGAIATRVSPCGLNCTYNLQFVGPHMICGSPQMDNGYMVPAGSSLPYYFGVWSNPQDDVVIPYTNPVAWGRRDNSHSVATFNASIYTPVGLKSGGSDIFVVEQSLQCKPGQAIYKTNVTYEDGRQNFDIQIDPSSIRVLMDLTQPNYFGKCAADCECCNLLECSCRPLSNANLQWLSDANNMAIIESMVLALAGQYNVELVGPDGADFNYTAPDGIIYTLQPVTISDTGYDPIHLADQGQTIASSGPQNGTIVASTAINQRMHYYNISDNTSLNLTVTQDILNEMLQNITFSLVNSLDLWYTDVNTTTSTFQNVYSFSNKLSLLLPYYISLVISIPLLVLGGLFLYDNGVSATDGGFLQVLTTTSNSKALHDAASGGALGGAENVPEKLKELKIRFGELVDGSRGGLKAVERRVGFGLEDEVVPIQKGVRYDGVDDARSSFGSPQSVETVVLLEDER